jgi:hypothetical protein
MVFAKFLQELARCETFNVKRGNLQILLATPEAGVLNTLSLASLA